MRVSKNEVGIGTASSGIENGLDAISFSALLEERDSYDALWRDGGSEGQTSEARYEVKSSSGSSEPSEPSVDRFEVDRSRLARQSLNMGNWEEDSKLFEDIREKGSLVTARTGDPLQFYSEHGSLQRCSRVTARDSPSLV